LVEPLLFFFFFSALGAHEMNVLQELGGDLRLVAHRQTALTVKLCAFLKPLLQVGFLLSWWRLKMNSSVKHELRRWRCHNFPTFCLETYSKHSSNQYSWALHSDSYSLLVVVCVPQNGTYSHFSSPLSGTYSSTSSLLALSSLSGASLVGGALSMKKSSSLGGLKSMLSLTVMVVSSWLGRRSLA